MMIERKENSNMNKNMNKIFAIDGVTKHLTRSLAVIAALTFFILISAAQNTFAATYTVTTTADSGAGSLRQAVLDATSAATHDTIVFNIPISDTGCNSATGVCTITLASEIQTTQRAGSLTINGTGADRLTIDGGPGANRIFFVRKNFTLTGVTLTGGNGTGDNEGNGGGAIWTNADNTFFNNVNFIGNSATGFFSAGGGGVYHGGSGSHHRYENCTFSGNTAHGDGGAVSLSHSTSFSSLTIVNSTLTGNRTIVGKGGAIGAVGFSAELTLQNNTITGNNGFGGGGGVWYSSFSETFTFSHNIIAGNIGLTVPDIWVLVGTGISNGYNLIGDSPGDAAATETPITYQPTDILDTPPQLAPLGNYGGATPTLALLSNSPAINAGTTTGALPTDQRGASRVGLVDIGAFELNNSANGSYRAPLRNGRPGVNYDFVVTPNNGSFTYTVTAGALPGGLTLSTNFAPNAVVALSGTPTQVGTFNFSITASDGAGSNVTDYSLQVLAPTAANVSVSGRVLTPDGRGLTNATIILADASGNRRTARTSSFGYFRFDEVQAGQTYVFSVSSKSYSFMPQAVTVFDDLTDLNFTAQQQTSR